MHKSGLPGSESQMASAYSAVAVSEQLVVEHLKYCRDLTRGFAFRMFPNFWRRWCKQILEAAEQARSNTEQVALYETQNLLVAVQQAAEQEFSQHLANGFVKFKNKSLNTLTGEERFSGDILSLVEHADLEETIAITSITHRADNLFAAALWALHQRLALLNDGEKIEEPGNPVSPVQFCEALRKLLGNIEIDVKTKLIGYKLFEEDVIGAIGDLYAELNDYLVRQNFLPNLRFVPASSERLVRSDKAKDDGAQTRDDGARLGSLDGTNESAPHQFSANPPSIDDAQASEQQADEHGQQRRASDRLLSGALDPADIQYQHSLLNAIRLLQTHITQQLPPVQAAHRLGTQAQSHATETDATGACEVTAAGAGTMFAPLQVYTQPQLVNVIDHMQHQALQFTQQALATHEAGGAVAIQTQHAADVGRTMMEAIANENANGAIEAEDMQTIDLVGMLFEYMLSDDHLPVSVKALLSYLHTPFLKIAFLDKDFFEQPEHPARMLLNSLAEAGVRWVSNDGSDPYEIFTKTKAIVFRLLNDFKSDVRVVAELLIEFKAYTHNVARRQELMERRALEKAQGEEKLREAKIQVNREVRARTDNREMPSAILLLLLQPWSDYLSFLVLRYGDKSDSWKRALQVIDELLWTLEPKTQQAEKVKQAEVQAELLIALQRGFETIGYDQSKGRKLLDAVSALQRMALSSRKAEPAPAPMRAKLESLAAEKAGGIVEDVQPLSPEEAKIVESLKMVEFGTWFEFDGGKRLKMAWYNKKTQHYMLVDQQGRKVSLCSGLQLARDMLARRAKVIAGSTKPFFERALENIYHTLNERADMAKAGSES